MINTTTHKLNKLERTISTSLKPMPLWESIILTMALAIMLYVFYYFMLPGLMESFEYPFLVAYLIAWGGGETLIFLASMIIYKLEGNPVTRKAFLSRYRLPKMNKGDFTGFAVLLTFSLLTYFGLTFTAEWLGSIPGFAPPDFFPAELTPGAAGKLIPGEFMGFPLKGMWWVLVAYFFGWLFNILGEEFWFRGYMLPRQELTYGRYAWILQGVLFTLVHIYWKWNLIAILPGSLLMAYIVQKRQNTMISILSHGFMNFIPMFVILQGILA